MAGARNGPKAIIRDQLNPNTAILEYACADGNALSRGTLVEVRDAMVASMANAWTLASSASSGAFCGVVIRDKEASDTSGRVAVLKEGRMDVRASGAINAGEAVYCAGNDEVKAMTVGAFGGLASSHGLLFPMVVGIAEETAADGEVIVVRFNK